jgi:hypothetical protein
MKLNNVFAILICSLVLQPTYALDSVCNEEAEFEPWKVGVKGRNSSLSAVLSGTPPEWRELVEQLNSLPPITDEKVIYSLIGSNPRQEIRLTDYSAKLNWHLPAGSPNFSITMHLYRGCISRISLTNFAKPKEVYVRSTNLATVP